MRVLVIENKAFTQDRLTPFQSNGFAIEAADGQDEMLNLLRHHRSDLILLPAMLPGGSISTILQCIRAAGFENPALVFSDQSSVRQEALLAGTDDAVAESTEPEEPITRIRAVTRRSRDCSLSVMSHWLSLCLDARSVTVAGHEIQLTAKSSRFCSFSCFAGTSS